MDKHLTTPKKAKMAKMMKKKWFRELVLLIPTITGKRSSNKTEDYGVFNKSHLSHLEQLSMYVSNIEKSRSWYEEVAGMTHSRTCDPEPHPTKPNVTIRCCYMSAAEQEESLILIEQTDAQGNIIKPSTRGFFHTAFELVGHETFAFEAYETVGKLLEEKDLGFFNYGVVRHNEMPPNGDGESGGNSAYYIYDPDYHNIEFFSGMDTVDNYQSRYGDKKGSQRS